MKKALTVPLFFLASFSLAQAEYQKVPADLKGFSYESNGSRTFVHSMTLSYDRAAMRVRAVIQDLVPARSIEAACTQLRVPSFPATGLAPLYLLEGMQFVCSGRGSDGRNYSLMGIFHAIRNSNNSEMCVDIRSDDGDLVSPGRRFYQSGIRFASSKAASFCATSGGE